MIATTAALGPLTLWAAAGTLTAHAQEAPRVMVNGAAVNFSGQPPVEQNGRVLVPLRGVLEKMGAYVDYDARSRTVVAQRGDTHITLPVGGRQALVNNRSVPLDVPAQSLNGSTLVPLRFVAESLGAQVDFNVGTNTVAIVSSGGSGSATSALAPRPPVASTAPAPASDQPAENTVVGTVVSVYDDLSPRRIVVHQGGGDGKDVTISLRPRVDVRRERPDRNDVPLTLSRLNAGARVAVLRDREGYGIAINVLRNGGAPAAAAQTRNNPPVSGVFKGEFLDFSRRGDDLLLKMTDGREIVVPSSVPILYNDQKIGTDDLRSGDKLTIAVDPVTRRGTRIIVAAEP